MKRDAMLNGYMVGIPRVVQRRELFRFRVESVRIPGASSHSFPAPGQAGLIRRRVSIDAG